jgi:hypothetical protein
MTPISLIKGGYACQLSKTITNLGERRRKLPRNNLENPLPRYVKDSNLDVHVRVFKAVIKANGEIEDAEFVNLFSFTLRDIMFD